MTTSLQTVDDPQIAARLRAPRRVTMAGLAWSEVRSHPVRYVATLAATAIGVGFVVALLVFVPTQQRSMEVRSSASTAVADVVVDGVKDPSGTLASRVAAVPGVAWAEPRYESYLQFSAGGRPGTISLTSMPTDPRLRWLQLERGAWPAADNQLAISAATASAYDLAVGDSLVLQLDPDENGTEGTGGTNTTSSTPQSRVVQVVGITDEGHSLLEGTQASGLAPVGLFTGPVRSYPTVLVLTAPGAEPGQVADAIRRALPGDATVQTSQELAQSNVDALSGGVQTGQLLLLVFGVIALLVGGMIITNTQLLVLTQRRRQLALLRMVGADRAQVRRSLLVETLLVGAIGSAIGVGLGVALALGLAAATDSMAGGLVVPLGQLALAVLAGLMVGLGASVGPTWRATRVSPIEALRPVADAAQERRIGRLRIGLSTGLLVVGGAVVALAAQQGNGFPLTVGGCALLALGILLLAPTYVPPLLKLLGRLVGRTGPTARLAAANLTNHPRRTAATATALMLAVGLIVALQVGAASVKASVRAEVAQQFPVDVSVQSTAGAVTPTVRAAVAAVPGVEGVAPVTMAEGTVIRGDNRSELTVVGVGSDAAAVAGGGTQALQPGVALVHGFTLEGLSAHNGDTVVLQVGRQRAELRLQTSDLADSAQVVVPAATLRQLAPEAEQRGLWVKADHEHPAQVIADVQRATASQPGLTVAGSLVQGASVDRAVDTVLLVATVLLGVAVLIAVIGVGSTISLSVVERARETALLRALGLQRRQLRGMLALEAGLLAVAAAVIGIAAGIGFGVVGTSSLLGAIGASALHLAVSVPQTLVVVAVALAAGLLASVLPGRRAARTSPAAVLADD